MLMTTFHLFDEDSQEVETLLNLSRINFIYRILFDGTCLTVRVRIWV